MSSVETTRQRLRDRSDATIIGFWNDRDGSLTWMIALEEELRHRGYTTRDDKGMKRRIPIPGDKHDNATSRHTASGA